MANVSHSTHHHHHHNRSTTANIFKPYHLIWYQNLDFFNKYFEFIEPEYRSYYFKYDSLANLYDSLKKDENPNILPLEFELYAELSRLHALITTTLRQISLDIRAIELKQPDTALLTQSPANPLQQIKKKKRKKKKKDKNKERDKEDTESTLERILRSYYDRLQSLLHFYELNYYVIRKFAKKYEKIAQQTSSSESLMRISEECGESVEFSIWCRYPSYKFFTEKFVSQLSRIEAAKQKCIDLYASLFRQKYPSLAKEELKYVKTSDYERNDWMFQFGGKVGIILVLVSF